MSQKDSLGDKTGQLMVDRLDSQCDLGQASIPAVNQYLQLARIQKLPVADILLELGLDHQLLKDNSQHIQGFKFQQLIAKLVNLSKDELFGLHTARFVQPGSYSVLGYISMNCETLGEAIARIQPFEKLVGDMGTTTIEQSDIHQSQNIHRAQNIKISWVCRFPDKLVRRHMIDNCLASWVTFARYLCDRKTDPSQVWLSRDKPDEFQQAEYMAMFNCPVLFNQPTDSILFNKALLQLPLNKGDKHLLTTLESHAEELINKLPQTQDVVSQTQNLIKQNLYCGQFRQRDIANLLGIGSKTLQRRLSAQNTQFKKLLDQVRLNLALDLLKNSSLNLDQISIKLGFSEPRSFYRWFSRISEQTPGDYRKHS